MKPHPLPARGARPAFTLIELLTVIAIIGILAAILIPVVGKVRQQAKTATCLSNLRQVGVAFQLYLSDNRSVFPTQAQGYVAPGSGASYWEQVGPYADWRGSTASNQIAANSIMHCPNHFEHPGAFSYRANSLIVRPPAQSGVRLSEVENPQQKILLYEVHVGDWWPWTQTSASGTGKSPYVPEYGNPPHGNVSNHLFVDGHVASTSAALINRPLHWNVK